MKRFLNIIAAGFLSLAAGTSFAACDYPSKVTIPDGNQATTEEMFAGQKAIKAYMESMNAYLDCIEAETKAAASEGEAEEITIEREALLAKRHNAAIEEMEKVAAEFNVQVRAYKSREE